MPKTIIIGAGLAGLTCANRLLDDKYEDFIILEKAGTVYKNNSWKTLASLAREFNLDDCISNEVKILHIRTFDLKTKKILMDYIVNKDDITDIQDNAIILDNKKVYNKLEKILDGKIKLNNEVEKITKQEKFKIETKTGEIYECETIIDASGVANVTDQTAINNHWFKQSAYFTCYGQRYTNCKLPKETPSFFDFESPKLFGTWCYPIDASTIEIGVSRYAKKLELETNKAELEKLLEEYTKLPPFDEYVKDATPGNMVYGSIPLLPRPYNTRNGILFIGDAKGTVYSGQGLFNALLSARNAADSIALGTKYDYNACQPLRNMMFLNMVWQFNADELKILFTNITRFTNEDMFKFLTGRIDNEFMLHALKATPKELMSAQMKNLNKSMFIRSMLNCTPKETDYKFWQSLE